MKLAVLTSGGDSPGMNACLRAVAKIGAALKIRVFGALDGYDGLIEGRFRELTLQRPNGEVSIEPSLELAGALGGTLIGSARSSRFREADGRAAAAQRVADAQLHGLIVIGGNGSLTGAHLLAQEQGVKVMGIPASIDNDVGCTATCLGVDTALNTILRACDNISDTARAHRRAFVVEVMGRSCGYLAMASAIASAADAALIREQGKSEAQLVEQVADVVRQGFAREKRRILIIKSEGIAIPTTRLVRLVEDKLNAELGQGVEIRATVLGHVVRGGSPSHVDRMVASRMALGAVHGIVKNATDEMVAWQASVAGGIVTEDAFVQRFPLAQVLHETEALLDGTSAVTQRRLKMMERVAGVLPL